MPFSRSISLPTSAVALGVALAIFFLTRGVSALAQTEDGVPVDMKELRVCAQGNPHHRGSVRDDTGPGRHGGHRRRRRVSARRTLFLLEPSSIEPERSVLVDLGRPIDLVRTMAHGRMGMADPCLRVAADGVWRATQTPDGLASQRLRVASRGVVQVDAWGPGADWLIARAPGLCGALDRPEAFQPEQPLLRHLVHTHPGLRIGRSEAIFETALFVTLEQKIATREAWHSWRVMVRSLGERAPGPLPDLWAPPLPARIAATPYEVFHRFGIERRRAETLRRLSVVAHRLEETPSLTLDAAYRRFQAIVGVGPWTAARIAMLGLGDGDAVFVGDLHLPHLVTSALAGEPRGSDDRMLELLEPYRGHRARVVRLLLAGRPARREPPERMKWAQFSSSMPGERLRFG
jgi:3-methyladenine DNA glycosylase/8-oxoguanine DNA glycosylase